MMLIEWDIFDKLAANRDTRTQAWRSNRDRVGWVFRVKRCGLVQLPETMKWE